MTKSLDQVLHDLHFSFSGAEKNSLNRLITTKSSFFYLWCNGGKAIDIVTIGNSADISTLNFYRVSTYDLKTGVDLDNSHPSLSGREALEFLEKAYSR